MIFREWGSAGNALIAGQVAINVHLLRSIVLQYKGLAGLKKVKKMLNWALILQISKTIIKHKQSKNILSYSNILSVKNSDDIFIPLSSNLIMQYELYFDQDGLARPGVPCI